MNSNCYQITVVVVHGDVSVTSVDNNVSCERNCFPRKGKRENKELCVIQMVLSIIREQTPTRKQVSLSVWPSCTLS